MTNDVDPVLTGAAFDLANAGYTPMRDLREQEEDDTISSDAASLREAAGQRAVEAEPVAVRQYQDGDGRPAPKDEAVTLARAARDYADVTAAERLIAEGESSKTLAARVDALRAEALANDPDAAEVYGFEQSGVNGEASDGAAHGAEGTAADESSSKLDAELEKALRHPQVLQAIEQRVSEMERARQGYRDGLAAATQLAQATFFDQFPELATISPESLPGALELMSRQDPARFAQVKAMVETSEQLIAQQGQQSRHQAEIARQNFQRFARAEDARLETMLKGEPPTTQHAVMVEIMSSARASGIEPEELTRLFNSEPLMRNAVFQRMMYDAGKYRLMMKAKEGAVARPLPPVQRLGVATTRAERDRSDIRKLSSKLSTSGDIKDAVALYQARKSSR